MLLSEKEILYNKRCAELLHYAFKRSAWNKTYKRLAYLDNSNRCRVTYDKMLFHSDWNWIMEMVEAIEKLDISVLIGKNSCVIEQYYGKIPIELPSIKSKTKKEAVVEAINQFLIWYEQNKNKTL